MAFDQDKACAAIEGGATLQAAAAGVGGSSHAMLLEHARRNPQFRDKLARALENRTEGDIERMRVLGQRVEDGDVPPDAARVSAGITQWLAARTLRNKYGDRVDQNIDLSMKIEVVNPFAVIEAPIAAVAAAIEPQALPAPESAEPTPAPRKPRKSRPAKPTT